MQTERTNTTSPQAESIQPKTIHSKSINAKSIQPKSIHAESINAESIQPEPPQAEPCATDSAGGELIAIRGCAIQQNARVAIQSLDWIMRQKEAWLVTGANTSQKHALMDALSGAADVIPNGAGSAYRNRFEGSVAVVSLERAASLIEREKAADQSEVLNRVDEGMTGRRYLCQAIDPSLSRDAPLPALAGRLASYPQVTLCGVQGILDRGLRAMSTGEIRRLLLCHALLSGKRLLILSNPFAGLDAQSKALLLEFFGTVATRQTAGGGGGFPAVILFEDRFCDVPAAINRVLEFDGDRVSFCGDRAAYERQRAGQEAQARLSRDGRRERLLRTLSAIRAQGPAVPYGQQDVGDELVVFDNVTVRYGDHTVLDRLSWTVRKGEHWFIRGPNGSGKTTMLELITGDNMQVFREDVRLFGKRRGTGETLWDIRQKLGIVSYRLHVEYRMVGGTDLEGVIVSGFRDSIGLYERATDAESQAARAWLALAGFAGREHEAFGSLSYGEQRAVLILRAAVKCPPVLLLDEPCHGLDEHYRDTVRDLLETIAATGTTTLLHVTHDPTEVLPCERHVLELVPGMAGAKITVAE